MSRNGRGRKPSANAQKMNEIANIRAESQRLQVPFDLAHIRKAPGFEVPEIEGTVEGWRAWTVGHDVPPYGVAPKLGSVTFGGYTWYPQQVAEAECSHDHTPADARCSCGFYSAKSLRHLMQLGYHSYGDYDTDKYVKVVGRTANWGQVTEATSGWRSQYSYPVMLFVPYEAHKLAKPLETAFGCKVRLLNFLKNPGDLDQVAVVSGKQEFEALGVKPKQQGRRCRHESLPLQGYLGGEPETRADGEEWVQVRWDVRPDDPKWMKCSSLVISRKEDHR